MSRPNFTVSLPGACFVQSDVNPTGSSKAVSDIRYSSEVTTGTTRRKPKGKFIPPTDYFFERDEYHRAYGKHRHYISGSNWYEYRGYIEASGFNTLNQFNELCSKTTAVAKLNSSSSLVKARNKLKDGRVNLAVAFAERNRTATMVGDTARNLALSVRQLRRGRWKDALRTLGVNPNVKGKPRGTGWTNQWLQMQYGWKPLLSDVYGACDALSKRPPEDWMVHVTAQSQDYQSWEHFEKPLGSSQPTGNLYAWSGRAERRRGVFTRIDAIPDNDLSMSLSSLGVTNPLLVGWELVPYSFVVDWFLPVGNWLESLDALLGYGKSYSSISYWNECSWLIKGVSRKDYTLPKRECINEWEATRNVASLTRSASAGVPQASFPRLKDPRSLGHMANGLSLLAQAFAR